MFLSGGRDAWLKIPAGIDALPMAFAEALGDRVQTGLPVTKVVRDENGVAATYGPAAKELRGRKLICTVPLPVIDKIEFDPVLSASKQAAFEATILPGRHPGLRPVRAANLGGRRFERLGVDVRGRVTRRFWHPTWNQEGPRGILMSYMFGELARRIAATSPSAIVPGFIGRFNNLFPGTREVAEHGTHFAWEHQPWIGAAFANYNPPFSEHPELASPEGPIHFAGEHASGHRGWMQGALESGLRAAREIDTTVTEQRSRAISGHLAAADGAPYWRAPRMCLGGWCLEASIGECESIGHRGAVRDQWALTLLPNPPTFLPIIDQPKPHVAPRRLSMFTPDQFDHYNREGYVVYPDFISGEDLAGTEVGNRPGIGR